MNNKKINNINHLWHTMLWHFQWIWFLCIAGLQNVKSKISLVWLMYPYTPWYSNIIWICSLSVNFLLFWGGVIATSVLAFLWILNFLLQKSFKDIYVAYSATISCLETWKNRVKVVRNWSMSILQRICARHIFLIDFSSRYLYRNFLKEQW
jgi:hypothetical protein